jgi:hypothetical protein
MMILIMAYGVLTIIYGISNIDYINAHLSYIDHSSDWKFAYGATIAGAVFACLFGFLGLVVRYGEGKTMCLSFFWFGRAIHTFFVDVWFPYLLGLTSSSSFFNLTFFLGAAFLVFGLVLVCTSNTFRFWKFQIVLVVLMVFYFNYLEFADSSPIEYVLLFTLYALAVLSLCDVGREPYHVFISSKNRVRMDFYQPARSVSESQPEEAPDSRQEPETPRTQQERPLPKTDNEPEEAPRSTPKIPEEQPAPKPEAKPAQEKQEEPEESPKAILEEKSPAKATPIVNIPVEKAPDYGKNLAGAKADLQAMHEQGKISDEEYEHLLDEIDSKRKVEI